MHDAVMKFLDDCIAHAEAVFSRTDLIIALHAVELGPDHVIGELLQKGLIEKVLLKDMAPHEQSVLMHTPDSKNPGLQDEDNMTFRVIYEIEKPAKKGDPGNKYFVGRIEGNQLVSAYTAKNEDNARKQFKEFVEEAAKNAGLAFSDEQIDAYVKVGVVDFDDVSIVVRPFDNNLKVLPNDFIDFNKCPVGKPPFFIIGGQHQKFEVQGQTRSMLLHLTYGARRFSLIIDAGGIVLANGFLNGMEPRDPVSEQGFLWIDPFYLRENYDGEEAPTDELQIHTYDYRPGSSDEPVFSGRVNVETGAVEDVTEK